MNYGRLNLIAGVFLAVLFEPLCVGADEPKPLHRFDFERIEMGVDFWIGLYACDQGVANDAAAAYHQKYPRCSTCGGGGSDFCICVS